MRVYLGSDHAGFELKSHLITHLASLGHEPVDVGPAAYEAEADAGWLHQQADDSLTALRRPTGLRTARPHDATGSRTW